ncbi:8769_t:CDS:2 [Diversispora eburnea]|uniref:8769_t:CDS:1 n=1 Tax=Diversispora eburnea TaxID=1213867 RepID=A0A9N8VJS6_9GLOM|nr:8769_t:CDS:2 [Diversispora eburnea]
MKLKKECKDLCFLVHRKKTATACLSQDQEYLRYKKDLETIISNYNQGTNWYKTATLALNNVKQTKGTSLATVTGCVLVMGKVAQDALRTITNVVPAVLFSWNDTSLATVTGCVLVMGKDEKKSPQIINFWSLELEKLNYENVIDYHPVEEESQRARHIINILRWHVVDQEMFNSCMKQHSNNQLHLAEQSLQNLVMSNRIKDSDHSWMSTPITSIMQFFCQKLDDKYFDIDALTVVSVVSSIILYTPTPCRGLGSSPSENHIKAELWTKIFSNVFTLNKMKYVPVWELHHLISGNGGRGSARSDFAVIFTNHNNLQFPFFIVEFERDGFEIHKDNIVVVSEAVYELNRILALAHNLSEEEVNRTRIHIGLVNDTRISFNTITPAFNQEESTFVYTNNDKILSYNLIMDDIEKNIENVLKLVIYLRETICEDGLWIETILNREPTNAIIN